MLGFIKRCIQERRIRKCKERLDAYAQIPGLLEQLHDREMELVE